TTVTLISSNPAAITVPASVIVPAGSAVGWFDIQGIGPGSAEITITSGSSTLNGWMTVEATDPQLNAMECAEAMPIMVGGSCELQIWLQANAPTGGVEIALSVTDPTLLDLPVSVIVPAGQSSVTVAVPVLAAGSGTIQATVGSSSVSTYLETAVLQVSWTSTYLHYNRTGSTFDVSIGLTGAAPAGGTTVDFSSSDPAKLLVPATVTIPAGATWTTVSVTAGVVLGPVTLTATYGGATATYTIEIVPFGLLWFGGDDNVYEGNQASLVVTMNDLAPAGGVTLTLWSSDPTVAEPAVSAVFIPEGESMAQVLVNTYSPGYVQITVVHTESDNLAYWLTVLDGGEATPIAAPVAVGSGLQMVRREQ
ncbi:MAG TPA: hypothetical protein PK691_11340, partial [Thermomicrobiales bacterium]|nr:hypothetical protein [Thermomicrobiales bacterium]